MKKQSYPCVPGGIFIPSIMLLCAVVYIGLILFAFMDNQLSPFIMIGSSGFIVLGISCFFVTLDYAARSVIFYDSYLVCTAPLSKDIIIEYDKCFIGMDYHNQNGGRIWWIYFSYGKMPPYKNPKSGNRINSIKCQPGFVRMMFRDDIYDALLAILPKHQKMALVSARRVAGVDR